MKRIIATLAPLVTCPTFMLWHLVGAVVCVPAFLYIGTSPDPADGGYVAIFILPAWSAFVFTSLQKDLLDKPFGFVLPGHRDVLRLTSFLVGIAASLVASLPVLAYPGLDGATLTWAVWCAFCFGMTVYLVTLGVGLLLDVSLGQVGLFGVVVAVLSEFPSARMWVQESALFAPGWNSVVLAVLCVFAWRRSGSIELARRACSRPRFSLLMIWRRTGDGGVGGSVKREFRSGGWRGRLLQRRFDRISRWPTLSWRRHLAAALYEVSGHPPPMRSWPMALVALFAVAVLVFGGYAHPRETGAQAANSLYLASCLLGANLGIPLFTTMLLPVGRRERFWTGLTFAALGGLLVLASSLLIFILLLGMGKVAPSLSWGGEVYDFRPADLGLALIPLVHLPMSLTLKITCKKWLVLPELLLVRGVVFVVDQFRFQRGEEAFHRGVIVTVGRSAHAYVGVVLLK